MFSDVLKLQACSLGKLQQVEYLIKYGANPHMKDVYGISPLDEAIRNKHDHVVKLLKQMGDQT